MKRLVDYSLYLCTDRELMTSKTLEECVERAILGGVTCVQLREKQASSLEFYEEAKRVLQITKTYGVPLIINDRVDIALAIDADGVHLGKNDMSIAEARAILGSGYIIGSTVNSFEDVLCTLQSATPDYFGCGPFRETATKRNLSPRLGVDGYRDIIHKMRGSGIDIPVVAIGGIRKEDIPLLLECGISGIALSGSILNAQDPVAETQEVLTALKTTTY